MSEKKTRRVLCELEMIGDPDDGMFAAYTGCVDGNGRKKIAVISEACRVPLQPAKADARLRRRIEAGIEHFKEIATTLQDSESAHNLIDGGIAWSNHDLLACLLDKDQNTWPKDFGLQGGEEE